MCCVNIVVYMKTGCPWARKVTDLLKRRGLEWEEKDMRQNPAYASEAQQQTGQTKSPTLIIDGQVIPDAGVEDVEKFLDQAGKP